ncbi:MAG: ribosomal RNA small subunit methyltransferase A [Kiritimatiellae bacterium]|nr:ribosomal RNA small subunit methyltransferase A [Kiritimatiellia bacterium]
MTAPAPRRPSEVRDWCISRGFHPSRILGQNFLVDGNAIDFIVGEAGAAPGVRILEVGPGLGAITRPMLDRGARVVAIEKDARLAALLSEACAGHGDSFELVSGDALDVDLDALLARGFDAFVSNLPYSVGTRILLDLCRHPLAPPRMVVMVQREVADRLSARPGDPERGQAGVWVQARWRVRQLRTIGPSCFWPRPEISSTVALLELDDRLPGELAGRFYRVSKTAFTQRRKQLATILRNNAAALGLGDAAPAGILAAAGIDPAARPETLAHGDWLRLAAALPPELPRPEGGA